MSARKRNTQDDRDFVEEVQAAGGGTANNRSDIEPYLWMLTAAVAFTGMAVCARSSKDVFAWPDVALARAIIPFSLTALICWQGRVSMAGWNLAPLWVRSICGSISLLCTFYSWSWLPISDVLTLTNLFPLWVAVLSWPLLGQLPSWDVWICALTAVAGVALLQDPQFTGNRLAIVTAISASFFSALAMLGLNRLKAVDTRTIVLHFSSISLVICLALWLTTARNSAHAPRGVLPWVVLAGVGVFATGGQFCLTKAFTLGVPARVAVINLSQIGFGLAFDIAIWHHGVTVQSCLAMGLITLPTAWLLLRARPIVAVETTLE